ncbi:MAG: aspartate aminotransferase family protein, partial [Candidatus Thorarchaeota archaeon]|jgi:4-aminobutyrate aminotransferase-like enzyme
MLGVELVRDRETKEPATQEMVELMELCKKDGLLIGKGGFDGNVIRLQPPLELTLDQIEEACEIIGTALAAIEKNL